MALPANDQGGGQVRASLLPERRYLSRHEAADYLGVSPETFSGFGILYVDLGPRLKRWDVADIDAFMHNRKANDSVRTPEPNQKRGRTCKFTNGREARSIKSPGMTETDGDIAEVLELPTRS